MTYDPTAHDKLREGLAEQALGTLDGRARAELLDHVAACGPCAEELDALNLTADALVHLPAGEEPPEGFESVVMRRIRAAAPPSAATSPRRRVLALAAAVAVLVAFGAGWLLSGATSGSGTTQAGQVVSRPFSAHGAQAGSAYVYTGSPAWMFVAVDLPGAPSSAGCVVVATDGTRHDLGTFPLIGGKGAWGATLPVSYASLHQILLTSPTGAVMARLRPTGWSSYGSDLGRRGTISMRY